MVCHQDVPDEQAYQVTKAVFENLAPLRDQVKAAKDTTPANAALLAQGPIPFHPGALRYFKEVGAIK